MEGRMRKYGGQGSSPPPALKQQKQGRKIPVVYYLCRNRQLEHPHFIEVPLSSPDGLYLRDVISRLNVLRGKGMAAMYSWSCKRSYKNGFVWHDLSEDDLILPTNGTEFVLKGSELLDQLPSDKTIHGGAMGKQQNLKLSQSENPTPTSSRTNESSSSSSPTAFKDSKTPSPPSPSPPPPSPPQRLEKEQCPSVNRLASPTNTSAKTVSPSLSEYRLCKPSNAADASTQTEDGGRRTQVGRKNTRTRGVSTDQNSIDFEYEQNQSNRAIGSNNGSDLCRDEVSPPPTSSSASSSGRKMETLESLIRADCSKVNSFRILEEEEILIPTGPRLKATNVFMQLVTCGSISVKDHHSFGLVPTYKPKFSHMKFPSSVLANSVFIGELDYLSENPSFVGLRVEDKEFFSGSLLETKRQKEDVREGLATLKRSSSFNADRTAKSPYSTKEKERFFDSKCLPRPVKLTSNKPSRNESMRSAIADCPRNSSVGQECSQSSIDANKRITEIPSIKEDGEKTIKIEERLISGARVIIQSRALYDGSDGSSSS
ncbi:protein UPSTREAM OF FLC [Phalaenopsis equestris]|uniref:protein UPSTREAM OF FLC n=1 Tax=Phalaenopsis equestris TaxID=78828 RepID=UPI0009E526C4|nr:protein UPSTREAM OF FLC [Phalaenopsis equestris]